MRALIVLTLWLLSLPVLAQDRPAVERDFKAWHVSCRPDGYCAASTSGGDGIVLIVGRHAEQSYWELGFRSPTALPDEWNDFVVAVDGQETTFSLSEEVGAYDQPDQFYFLGIKAQEVMDRMTPGRKMSIAFTGLDSQQRKAEFSLEGFSASTFFIDEQQGRIGSERVASVPPYGLVPIRGGNTVAPNIPVALLDRQRADPECAPLETLANGRDFAVDELTDGYRLYVVPCWSAAYNAGWKVYLEGAGEFTPQYFASFDTASGWTGTPFVVNYDYDPHTKTLTEFNKARGPADCGSQAQWTWNGYLFRLNEYRYRDCPDEADENAEMPEFPVVYAAPEEEEDRD